MQIFQFFRLIGLRLNSVAKVTVFSFQAINSLRSLYHIYFLIDSICIAFIYKMIER